MCTRTPAHTHMDVHAILQIWATQGEDLHCIRCRQIIYKDAVGTKDIPCDGCQHEVRRKYFEQEQLDLWDAKEPGNYVCRKCQGSLGGTRMEDREVFECTNCRRKWTDCHFLDETIAAWKAKSKASLWCAQGHEETPPFRGRKNIGTRTASYLCQKLDIPKKKWNLWRTSRDRDVPIDRTMLCPLYDQTWGEVPCWLFSTVSLRPPLSQGAPWMTICK